jgi:predicted N-acyltransferase
MLKITLYDRITDIAPARWDAVGTDALSSHAVLTALEGAGIPGLGLRCVIMEDETGRTAAVVPYARMAIDGRHLAHGLFRRTISGLRNVCPGFMHTSLLICGTPLSVGNPPLRVAPHADLARILRESAGLLAELADQDDIPWRVFKEFPQRQLHSAAHLADDGWILAPSEPNLHLPIRWPSYTEYLQSLRSTYRYKMHKSARRLRAAGVRVDVVPLQEGYHPSLHYLYEEVLDRAAVRLESLTASFFQTLGHRCGDRARLIRFRRDERMIGWVAVLLAGDEMHDLFHGIDYDENRELDLYFNQLAATIRLAIEWRMGRLVLGQSTEMAKTRFGGLPQPLWIAVRHRREWVNAILRSATPLLFPHRVVPQRRVFRDEADVAREVV